MGLLKQHDTGAIVTAISMYFITRMEMIIKPRYVTISYTRRRNAWNKYVNLQPLGNDYNDSTGAAISID